MQSVLIILLLTAPAMGREQVSSEVSVNPIRRVVTMLQMMQSKIEAEAEKETEIHDKFMCWCETGAGSLKESIEAAETKIPKVSSSIEESEANLAKTKSDLATAKTDR